MKNLQRVVWSKGMFLTPQHFQVQDRFVEDNLQFRFATALFANWGVTSLRIDQEALANGTFTLQSCRGIFPDGLAFSFPDSEAGPGGRPFVEYFGPAQESLDVYLGIPQHLPQGLNFSSAAAGDGSTGVATRYTVEAVDINDESAASDQKTIQVARKNFQLLFEGQNMEGSATLRIARVARKDAGYALEPEFIAPCIDISSSEQIMMALRRLIEILATKSEALNANRRQRGKDLADYSVSEAANFWFLHTVKFLPAGAEAYLGRSPGPSGNTVRHPAAACWRSLHVRDRFQGPRPSRLRSRQSRNLFRSPRRGNPKDARNRD